MHENHFNSQLRRDGHCDSRPLLKCPAPSKGNVVAYNVGLRAQKCSANVYLGAVIHYCELLKTAIAFRLVLSETQMYSITP